MVKKTAIFLAVLALVIAGVGAFLARRSAASVPVLWQAPAFTLTDHRGSPFSSAELEGTIWIASFVYTSCPDVCPLITARMAQLRDGLAAEGVLGSRVRLVSFTVDPARDTPPVLRGYAERYGGAEPRRWAFLTGPADTIRKIVTEGFRLAAQVTRADQAMSPADATGPQPPSPAAESVAAHVGGGALRTAESALGDTGGGGPGMAASAPVHTGHGTPRATGAGEVAARADSHVDPYLVLHSPRLVLVDGAGRVRGTYPATEAESLAKLTRALQVLLAE